MASVLFKDVSRESGRGAGQVELPVSLREAKLLAAARKKV